MTDRYESIKHLRYKKKLYQEAKEIIHNNDLKIYHERLEAGEYDNLSKGKILRECLNCGLGFVAKKSDVNRGWAKFCSKSCKAQYKEE